MKLCIIFPPLPFGWTPVAPPILEYLAALTRRTDREIEIELVDGSSASDLDSIDCDLAAISLLTATAVPGYRIADGFRRRGIRVVLGGLHASALPEEAKEHADSVVVGEAESVWSEVLADARLGRLKPFYHAEALPMENIPTPLYGLLKGKYRFRGVFTSRGCPFNCSFCSVKQFFGAKVRQRPVADVVRDVEAVPDKIYMNGDENIWTGKLDRAFELFGALKGSRKKWMGFGSLGPVMGPAGSRLLDSAREAGLMTLWVGWEAMTEAGLEAYGARAKIGGAREDAIRKIKDHGIDVSLFFMLGGRADGMADFDRSLEIADRLGVSMHPSLAVPYPGTRLHEEYAPFIYPELGWEYYTGAYALFGHPDPEMTPEARERRFFEVSIELLSLKRLLTHLVRMPFANFPTAHMLSLMSQLPVRQGVKKAFEQWKGLHG